MGANVSTIVSEMSQTLKNTLSANCTNTNNVIQRIGPMSIKLSGNAHCGTISVKNEGKVTANCDLTLVSRSLAERLLELTEEQKAGLGFNISTDVDVNTQTIQNILEASCGNKTNVEQTLDGGTFEIIDNASCDVIDFMNKADATSSCIIKTVNDAVVGSISKKKKKQTGMSLFTIALGAGGLLCVVLLIVIVIAVASGRKGSKGSEDFETQESDPAGVSYYGGGGKLLKKLFRSNNIKHVPLILASLLIFVWYLVSKA